MKNLINLLEEKDLRIGSVESITGGLFASTISGVPGASKVYKGSLVTYTNKTKENMLGISNKIIKTHGVISEDVAYLMALKGQKILDVDVCVSFTGNAGPTTLEDKEAGLVYIGIALKKQINVYKEKFNGTRDQVRLQCVTFATNKIKENINIFYKK